jgi:hypothetical protein
MPYESDDTGDDTGDETGDETGDDTGDEIDEDVDEESLADEYNNQLDDQAPVAQLNKEVQRQDRQIRKGFDPRILREYDPRYAIHATAGPNLPTRQDQLKYREHESWSEWDSATNITSLNGYTYVEPPKTTKTSLITIKSTNRDMQVYPSSYNFQVKLPRVYKKVVKFQFVQMSFPKANNTTGIDDLVRSTLINQFIKDGVSSGCISSCLQSIQCTSGLNGVGLMEQGRTTSSGIPLLVTLSVPDGAYNNTQLAEELTFQANSTPPLNLISYPSFRDAFMNTRDISILFNEPGCTFSSKCNTKRYGMHTKEDIMNSYYTQQHIDRFSEITEKIAFVAYYFPILKELIATRLAEPFLQFADMTFADVSNAVLGPFRGLDDPLYFSLCDTNQYVLDAYRKYLTFELRNINQYNISYQTNRFSIIHDTLHPSLTRDLTKSYQNFLNQELSVRKLNTNSFKTLKTNYIGYSSILRHLESNLSSVLGTSHFATGYRYLGGMDHITDEGTLHAITDLHEDVDFTNMFSYTSTIGRIYGNYVGQRMTFTNFLDYHSTLSSYYQIVQSTNNVIQSIQQQAQQDFHSYVSSKYTGILPDSMITTQSYLSQQSLPVSFVGNQYVYFPGILPSQILPTESPNVFGDGVDPCVAICCNEINKLIYAWYSCIPVETNIQTIFFRLGLNRFPAGDFNIVSTFTTVVSTSYTNYLISINDEQGFNNMDISMNENYTISNETTGQVKYICAKVLMANVDNSNISQALIQNPIVFDQPLGKLDRLNFKIYFDDDSLTPAWLYVPSYLDVNEWNATFQIEEEIGYANVDAGWGEAPTISIPSNPNAMQYLFLKPPSEDSSKQTTDTNKSQDNKQFTIQTDIKRQPLSSTPSGPATGSSTGSSTDPSTDPSTGPSTKPVIPFNPVISPIIGITTDIDINKGVYNKSSGVNTIGRRK